MAEQNQQQQTQEQQAQQSQQQQLGDRGFDANAVIEQKDLGMDEGYNEGYRQSISANDEQGDAGRGQGEMGDDEDFVDAGEIDSEEDISVENPDVNDTDTQED